MFTQHFDTYVLVGDSIKCEVDGFECVATVYEDNSGDKPDDRDCGFWPSLDPKAGGFIGENKTEADLAAERDKMQGVYDAWRVGEWFYCGIDVRVRKAGIWLTDKYANSLWGVECNYPNERRNEYLREVANELLDEALDDARAKLALLCAPVGAKPEA